MFLYQNISFSFIIKKYIINYFQEQSNPSLFNMNIDCNDIFPKRREKRKFQFFFFELQRNRKGEQKVDKGNEQREIKKKKMEEREFKQSGERRRLVLAGGGHSNCLILKNIYNKLTPQEEIVMISE